MNHVFISECVSVVGVDGRGEKNPIAHLRVGVFAREVPKVTEYLALHVVLQGGEPAVGLVVHRVVQLQELHQLLRLHLQGGGRWGGKSLVLWFERRWLAMYR